MPKSRFPYKIYKNRQFSSQNCSWLLLAALAAPAALAASGCSWLLAASRQHALAVAAVVAGCCCCAAAAADIESPS